MPEKIVGIAGGMGPESTIDLMAKILAATRVEREQDHIHVIADSNPKTPDRTRFILGLGESPVPAIRDAIRRLVAAGADLILIPCNTAHVFFGELQSSSAVPLINMIEVCAEWVAQRYRRGDTFGVLATTGTRRSGIYEAALAARGFGAALPSDAEQEALMEVIYGPAGVKMGVIGPNAARARALAEALIARGAQAVIAACTEISLVLAGSDLPVIDPVRLLAEETVRLVKGPEAVRAQKED